MSDTARAADFRPVGPGWIVVARWGDTGSVEREHLVGWTLSEDGARWLPTFYQDWLIALDVENSEHKAANLSVQIVPASDTVPGASASGMSD